MQFNKKQLITFAIPLTLTFPAFAETNTPDQLSTISVTATRDELQTLEVPASVGVKNEEEIALDSPAYQKELFNLKKSVERKKDA